MEAHYPSQVWDLEVPLESAKISNAAAVSDLVSHFHSIHRQVFAVDDQHSSIEITGWTARVRCQLRSRDLPRLAIKPVAANSRSRLRVFR